VALKITDVCINCGVCVAVCPNEAIDEGEFVYEIDPAHCTECVGHFDTAQCQAICPVIEDGCIITDPERIESRQVLSDRYMQLQRNKGAM